MIRALTPNKAVAFAIAMPILYWVLAIVMPADVLRDIFNALAFGMGAVIVATWFSSAWRAVKEGGDTGEWLLIMAIFMVWALLLLQRVYSIVLNEQSKPVQDWLRESAITGFWPYSFTVAGMLFLAAPGVDEHGLTSKSVWAMVSGAAIGGIFAGVLIAKAISFD